MIQIILFFAVYFAIGLIVILFYFKTINHEFSDDLMSHSDESKNDTGDRAPFIIFVAVVLVWPVFLEEFINP